jgi:hypothetical protein
MTKKRINLGFIPREHQKQAHENRKRFSVIVWHRRAGKTIFAVLELLLAAAEAKRKDSRFAYIAPYYGQAKSVCWDILKGYASQIPGVEIKEGELRVILPNGSTIRLFGADNPNTLRGLYFDGVVLDEVSDMRPEIWGTVIRPLLTDRQGWALFIGTPNGINLFSEVYYSALKDPEWYADLKRYDQTNAVPLDEIERARKEMAPPIFSQEFECDFHAASANAFIPLNILLEAQRRLLNPHSYDHAAMVLGCDIARFGSDRSIIFPRQGLQAFIPHVFRQLDTMQMAAQISNKIEDHKSDMAFIDEIGVGGGVLDRLRQTATPGVMGVISGSAAINPKFKNLRAEMISKVKDWIIAGGCIPEVDGLANDFCAPTYWYDSADRLQIESKEQMKARGLPSCDFLDSFALTFAMPVQKKTEFQKFQRANSREGYVAQGVDYDVLG